MVENISKQELNTQQPKKHVQFSENLITFLDGGRSQSLKSQSKNRKRLFRKALSFRGNKKRFEDDPQPAMVMITSHEDMPSPKPILKKRTLYRDDSSSFDETKDESADSINCENKYTNEQNDDSSVSCMDITSQDLDTATNSQEANSKSNKDNEITNLEKENNPTVEHFGANDGNSSSQKVWRSKPMRQTLRSSRRDSNDLLVKAGLVKQDCCSSPKIESRRTSIPGSRTSRSITFPSSPIKRSSGMRRSFSDASNLKDLSKESRLRRSAKFSYLPDGVPSSSQLEIDGDKVKGEVDGRRRSSVLEALQNICYETLNDHVNSDIYYSELQATRRTAILGSVKHFYSKNMKSRRWSADRRI